MNSVFHALQQQQVQKQEQHDTGTRNKNLLTSCHRACEVISYTPCCSCSIFFSVHINIMASIENCQRRCTSDILQLGAVLPQSKNPQSTHLCFNGNPEVHNTWICSYLYIAGIIEQFIKYQAYGATSNAYVVWGGDRTEGETNRLKLGAWNIKICTAPRYLFTFF